MKKLTESDIKNGVKNYRKTIKEHPTYIMQNSEDLLHFYYVEWNFGIDFYMFATEKLMSTSRFAKQGMPIVKITNDTQVKNWQNLFLQTMSKEITGKPKRLNVKDLEEYLFKECEKAITEYKNTLGWYTYEYEFTHNVYTGVGNRAIIIATNPVTLKDLELDDFHVATVNDIIPQEDLIDDYKEDVTVDIFKPIKLTEEEIQMYLKKKQYSYKKGITIVADKVGDI